MAKKQIDYTLSDVVRLRPKWLENKQDDAEAFNELIDFIGQMMSSGRTQIATYGFMDVFPHINISQYKIPDINRILFEYEEANKPVVLKRKDNPNLKVIRAAYSDGCLRQSSSDLEDFVDARARRVRNVQSDADSYANEAERALRNYRDYEASRVRKMKIVSEYEMLLAAAQDKLANFTGGLDKDKLAVLKAIPKHYRVVRVGEYDFSVVNVTPIILTETNAAAGINRTLNLGHFKYTFSYNMNFIGIQYFADNIQGTARHPHVNGYICWGNLQSLADNRLESKDYVGWWQLFDQLQANYNSGSPFAQWATYIRNKNTDYTAISPDFKAYMNTGKAVTEEIYRNNNSDRFKKAYEELIKPNHRRDEPIPPRSL
jgi:hypothetical protein